MTEATTGCAPGKLVKPATETIVENSPEERTVYWGRVLIVLTVPIIVLWLLAFLTIATTRWVATGFQREQDD